MTLSHDENIAIALKNNRIEMEEALIEVKKKHDENVEQLTEKMIQRFPDLNMNHPSILKSACAGSMKDIKMLEFMISKVKKIKRNQITEHDASVEVGQRLVDEIVKPQIEKSKN